MLYEDTNVSVRWYDVDQTILLIEITDRWTWEQAYKVIVLLDETIVSVSPGVYTIFHFAEQVPTIPQGSVFAHLRHIATAKMINEHMILVVGCSPLLRNFIEMTSKFYSFGHLLGKMRFVHRFQDALDLIHEHRDAQPVR